MTKIKKCFKFDMTNPDDAIKNISNDIDAISVKITHLFIEELKIYLANNKVNDADEMVKSVINVMCNCTINALLPIFQQIEKSEHPELTNYILELHADMLKTGIFSVLAHMDINDE